MSSELNFLEGIIIQEPCANYKKPKELRAN
jgi:hypothetical protein